MELEAYDLILNACYDIDPPTAIDNCIISLKSSGLSDKQIKRVVNKVKATGAPFPNSEEKYPIIIFEADEKFIKISRDAAFQNVADKFLLFIYGKKYNNGINGAFGEGQNIKSESKKNNIIIRFPKGSENMVYGNNERFSKQTKIMSSIEHYRSQSNGYLHIEFV